MKIGVMARDKFTGFEGLVTGHVVYLTGCEQYLIQPHGLDKDGKPADSVWLDESRIEEAIAVSPSEVEAGRRGSGPGLEPGKR